MDIESIEMKTNQSPSESRYIWNTSSTTKSYSNTTYSGDTTYNGAFDFLYIYQGEKITPLRENSPDELMKKEYLRVTKDEVSVTLTLGEIYELNKMKYKVEDMTFEELKKALVIIRL